MAFVAKNRGFFSGGNLAVKGFAKLSLLNIYKYILTQGIDFNIDLTFDQKKPTLQFRVPVKFRWLQNTEAN